MAILPHLGFVDAAPQDGRHLDFNLCSGRLYRQLGHNAFTGIDHFIDVDTLQVLSDTTGDPLHGGIDGRQGFGPARHRQVGQINIDGQPRQVTNEEIDCGPALQGKTAFLRHKGNDRDQQGDLTAVLFSWRHKALPVQLFDELDRACRP